MLNKLPDDATLKQASSFVGEIKTEIDTQRSKLASILTEKGATASKEDKMSILIDMVNNLGQYVPPPTYLCTGQDFNSKIKAMSNYNNATKIVFEQIKLIEGISSKTDATDVSLEQDGSIYAYFDTDTIHVVSDGIIIANDNLSNMFGKKNYYDECNISHIYLDNFVTDNVTNMSKMFYNCDKLIEINGLNKFNTTSVKDMSQMFSSCSSLTTLDVSSFNTSNVVNMRMLFYGCTNIKFIKGIEYWNTNKVTNMSNIFQFCSNLQYLSLFNWNVSTVESMPSMFGSCENLKYVIGLENFETDNANYMSGMFENCNVLNGEITIKNPNISNEYGYNDIFLNCSTNNNSKFVVNYISECKNIAQNMVNTKSSNSNVVLGTQIG